MPPDTFKRIDFPFRAARGVMPFPWNFGITFGRLFREFRKHETWSTEKLEAYSTHRLFNVVEWACKTVPRYRNLSSKNWESIPITTKSDLREGTSQFVSEAIQPARRLKHKTSGSTGTPLEILSTRKTWQAEKAIMLSGWAWSGFSWGDRVVTCVGSLPSFYGDPPISTYRSQMDISSAHLGPASVDHYLDAIVAFAPKFLRMYPTTALLLGRRFRERGMSFPPLRAIWTQSETLTEKMRGAIQELWGSPIFDYYSMQEKGVAMSQCEAGNLHIRNDFGFVELLPSNVPNLKRIIVTGFYNEAMPLLRYDTGDLAQPLQRPCACGRPFPAVKRIEGRLEDILIGPDGRIIQELDHAVMEVPSIKESQIIQEQVDWLRICVVAGTDFNQDQEEFLISKIMEKTGPVMRLTVERVNSLPRTYSGKLRFVVSKVRPS